MAEFVVTVSHPTSIDRTKDVHVVTDNPGDDIVALARKETSLGALGHQYVVQSVKMLSGARVGEWTRAPDTNGLYRYLCDRVALEIPSAVYSRKQADEIAIRIPRPSRLVGYCHSIID